MHIKAFWKTCRIGLLVIIGIYVYCQPGHNKVNQLIKESGIQGGLIVHLGCEDAGLINSIGSRKGFMVHALSTDETVVNKLRRSVADAGLYGRISVETWNKSHLPYIDNLVNLMIIQDPDLVPMTEVMRVLAPQSVSMIAINQDWEKHVKKRPQDMDEWGHYLHNADNNAVSSDKYAGPPRRIQWLSGPTWSRHHDMLASTSAVVTTNGRLYAINDEGSRAFPRDSANWVLTARDAFNGVCLWKRKITTWADHLRKFRSGPVQVTRLLVADENRVYTTLGISQPVKALDATTGETVLTYDNTRNTEEIILSGNILLTVSSSDTVEQGKNRGASASYKKYIQAMDVKSGKYLWRWPETEYADIIPLTLAANDEVVIFRNNTRTVCLTRSGHVKWQSDEALVHSHIKRLAGWSEATVLIHDGIVLSSNAQTLKAFDLTSGKFLWSKPISRGFKSPTDVFVINGRVWVGMDFDKSFDLYTGETDDINNLNIRLITSGHHHRCFRNKATQRYIIKNYRGMEFIDLKGDNHSRNNWVRGACQYGVMPANGLLYAPPHNCGCYMEAKLYGFWALAPEGNSFEEISFPLEKGPAFRQTLSKSTTEKAWPTFRQNMKRSGVMPVQLPSSLSQKWNTRIEGRLTAPVCANDIVYVASIDEHCLYAIDAVTGDKLWQFRTGGRIDSPPTIYRGLALFGSADGWIYCLNAVRGDLAWRFRGAPSPRKTVAYNQLESVWPVHGNVLVKNNVAYFVSGRSTYLDDGLFLFGLDPVTGEVKYKTHLSSEHPDLSEPVRDPQMTEITQNITDYKTFTAADKSDAFSMSGGNISDVLVADENNIYLRYMRFDSQLKQKSGFSRHLFSTSSLLDPHEAHRSHWYYGLGDFSRLPVAYEWLTRSGSPYGLFNAPFGVLLVFDNETIWGIRRQKEESRILYCQGLLPLDSDFDIANQRKMEEKDIFPYNWKIKLPGHPRALVKAGDHILVVCNPRRNQREGKLIMVDANTGTHINSVSIPAGCVFDGMAVVENAVLISLDDGQLLCLKGQ